MKTKCILIIVTLGILISMGVHHLSAVDYIDLKGEMAYLYINNHWVYGCDCYPESEFAECWCRIALKKEE